MIFSIVPKVGQMNEHHGPSTVNCCTKQGVGRFQLLDTPGVELMDSNQVLGDF